MLGELEAQAQQRIGVSGFSKSSLVVWTHLAVNNSDIFGVKFTSSASVGTERLFYFFH
ncbi:MAG: hypothetical protein SNJ70_02265 [Armatimonadota bacterium]